jgi:peptidoglycan-associated lipoprotein
MRGYLRTTGVSVMGMFVVGSTGCLATRGQLRRGLAEQTAALEAERSERLTGDQRLAADLGQLRTDLDGLRREFGTRITMLEDGMQFAVPVHFAFNKADLNAEAEPVLTRFSEVAAKYYPGAKITVEGFADPAGTAEYNRRLSQQRADAVRKYLVQKGLPPQQLAIVGYGEDRQVVPGASGASEGAELNRRVVFVVETPPNSSFGSNGEISSR